MKLLTPAYLSLKNNIIEHVRYINIRKQIVIFKKITIFFNLEDMKFSRGGIKDFETIRNHFETIRCRQSCSADCFEILDSAPTKFQLKLKEAMHINWEKPNLNQQVHHVNLTLTL